MKQGMKDLERILKDGQREIQSTLGFRLKPEIEAFLGNPVDQAVYFDDTHTLVFVHGFGEEPNSATVIPVGNIPKNKRIFGQPIIIRETINGYRFIRVNDDLDAEFSEGTDNQQDNTPVYLSQLAYGTIHPYAGLQVLVKSAVYDGIFTPDLVTDAFDGTALDTLSNPVEAPTTNNRAIAVLIQLDAATDNLEYKQSSEFNASLSLEQVFNNEALPLADSDRYRVGYVKLTKGISFISYADIYNAPEIFNIVGSATNFDVAGDSGTPQTIEDGNTLSILGGTNIATVASATDTLTVGLTGQVAIANGGTGASSAASARANLGLGIGSTVQAYRALLDNLSYAVLRDEKSSGTAGGSSSATTWNARDLNTESYDADSIVSISSNEFTPISGTYLIIASAPALSVGLHKLRLYNVTDASVAISGSSERTSTSDTVHTRSMIISAFTANGTDAYRIDHYTGAAMATSGLGSATSVGINEVYLEILLIRVV